MKKIKVLIFLIVLIIGISSFASPLLAISPNSSHVANCATEMGGQHVADCARTMDRGVSECAQMRGPCEH